MLVLMYMCVYLQLQIKTEISGWQRERGKLNIWMEQMLKGESQGNQGLN
jgi:hypothetical protein